MTLDEARDQARQLLAAVDRGEDPAQARQDRRGSATVVDLLERFYDDHVLTACKPKTQVEYRRTLDLFVKPTLRTMKVLDVQRRDIAELHHKHRTTPYQANRTLRVLSKMFNLAEMWGLRADGSNPCRHVSKYKEENRERFLSAAELARLGAALEWAEQDASEALPKGQGGRPDHPDFKRWVETLHTYWTKRLGQKFGLTYGELGMSPAVQFFTDLMAPLDPAIDAATVHAMMLSSFQFNRSISFKPNALAMTESWRAPGASSPFSMAASCVASIPTNPANFSGEKASACRLAAIRLPIPSASGSLLLTFGTYLPAYYGALHAKLWRGGAINAISQKLKIVTRATSSIAWRRRRANSLIFVAGCRRQGSDRRRN